MKDKQYYYNEKEYVQQKSIIYNESLQRIETF